MDNTKRLIINVAGILAVSIIGAGLMMAFDLGGTRWLKFLLYMLFFASLSSAAIFPSRLSCAGLFRSTRKRS